MHFNPEQIFEVARKLSFDEKRKVVIWRDGRQAVTAATE
jgi:hypothetical protein